MEVFATVSVVLLALVTVMVLTVAIAESVLPVIPSVHSPPLSQSANPQTYSDDEVYATNGELRSKSLNINDEATIDIQTPSSEEYKQLCFNYGGEKLASLRSDNGTFTLSKQNAAIAFYAQDGNSYHFKVGTTGNLEQFDYGNNTHKVYVDTSVTDNLVNTFYAVSNTGASVSGKAATTVGRNFRLETGSMVRVKFASGNTYNGTATLDVDSTGAKTIVTVGTTETSRYYWVAGEVVDFVYDGTNYIISKGGIADSTYYGMTKLVDSVTSTSTSYAATPNAVKTAYDLAAAAAPKASPDLTGTPTAPTAAAGTNTTQIATTAFVSNAIGNLSFVSGAEYNLTAGNSCTITHSNAVIVFTDRGGLWTEGITGRTLSAIATVSTITVTRASNTTLTVANTSTSSATRVCAYGLGTITIA